MSKLIYTASLLLNTPQRGALLSAQDLEWEHHWKSPLSVLAYMGPTWETCFWYCKLLGFGGWGSTLQQNWQIQALKRDTTHSSSSKMLGQKSRTQELPAWESQWNICLVLIEKNQLKFDSILKAGSPNAIGAVTKVYFLNEWSHRKRNIQEQKLPVLSMREGLSCSNLIFFLSPREMTNIHVPSMIWLLKFIILFYLYKNTLSFSDQLILKFFLPTWWQYLK
jgi:hypothetical protein